MFDEIIDWISVLLPWRVWLALVLAFVALVALLWLWTTW
jgi:hypothetical protein